ncbi:MAG: Tim44/TimA family putative adaptor protein [Halocynthiibacter sp.]
MNPAAIQLLVLAGVAVFLVLKLRSVLGTRDGFEKSKNPELTKADSRRADLAVIEGGPDRDITDHVDEGSDAANALVAMKAAEPGFGVDDFLQGGRGAYEMILMGFERGDLDAIQPFLSDEVFASFSEVVKSREEQGLTIEAEFVGVRDVALVDANYDKASGIGEVTVKFVAELTSVVRDSAGDIVEGSKTKIKSQKDVWTFARKMGADNPNWQLVATGE